LQENFSKRFTNCTLGNSSFVKLTESGCGLLVFSLNVTMETLYCYADLMRVYAMYECVIRGGILAEPCARCRLYRRSTVNE